MEVKAAYDAESETAVLTDIKFKGSRFTKKQKITLGVVAAVIVAVIIALIVYFAAFHGKQVPYVKPLFSEFDGNCTITTGRCTCWMYKSAARQP